MKHFAAFLLLATLTFMGCSNFTDPFQGVVPEEITAGSETIPILESTNSELEEFGTQCYLQVPAGAKTNKSEIDNLLRNCNKINIQFNDCNIRQHSLIIDWAVDEFIEESNFTVNVLIEIYLCDGNDNQKVVITVSYPGDGNKKKKLLPTTD